MEIKHQVLEDCDDGIFIRPRYYADVNLKRPPSYWNYDQSSIEWGNQDDYEVVQKIGRGKYCEAFEGFHVPTKKQVVIKLLKAVKKRKIKRELKILQHLSGGPNIVQLLDFVCDPVARTPSFVFEYINNTDFKLLYPTFTDADIRLYMSNLMDALDYCHSQGIVHRDVKPQNIIIDHPSHNLKLIDWGLAEFYHLYTPLNVRVASRYYKGPELLVNYELYDYSLDMWSLGCMFAGLIFQREPFFRGADNYDQLVKITKVLGSESLYAYLNRYDISADSIDVRGVERYNGISFHRYITAERQPFCDPDAMDLVEKLLVFDHAQRMLPKESYAHPYFMALKNGTVKDPSSPSRSNNSETQH